MERKQTVSAFLSLTMVLSLCSCTSREDSFPSLEYPSSETTEILSAEGAAASEQGDLIELSVALPYSDTTVNRLVKYYYGLRNGLIGEGTNGLTVDLDYLDSIDIPWIINSVSISGEGTTYDSFDDEIPDLVLLSDINGNIDDLLCITEILAMDPMLSENDIYFDSFDNCTVGGEIFGIPHYASFTVLVGNIDFVPSGGRIGYSPTVDELSSYIEAVNDEFSDEGVIAFTGSDSSWDGLLAGFSDSLYEEGIARDLDDDNADPRFSRTAAIWPASSGSASVWEDYYPDSIYYFTLPSFSDGSDDLIQVYSLGIKSDCEYPQLCADIGCFISYDTNALLLIQRLESPQGYFPLVTDNMVWNQVRATGGVNSVFAEDSYD